jgi:hypothetical protein
LFRIATQGVSLKMITSIFMVHIISNFIFILDTLKILKSR